MVPRIVARRDGYLHERAYQQRAKELLQRHYPREQVETQWYPFKGEERNMYWPVVDIAVGPFAMRERLGYRYTELMSGTRALVERLIEFHNQNVEELGERMDFETLLAFNENARCLFCIEIEESGSRKHCLGNLVNASALGRLGLLVARNRRTLNIFVRERAYLRFLEDVGKNTFKTANALVVTEEQFDQWLGHHAGR
jgi:hypothetical protein